jgi:aspartate-semialdehyde dehydrogenase
MQKKYNIAVIGATGVVGRETLEILADRKFPINKILAIASEESLGKKVSFGDESVYVDLLEDVNWSEIDIIFSSAGSEVTKLFIDKCALNTIVIDKTSLFRLDPDVPLIVPEINSEDIGFYVQKNIIANPNCCVIPIALTLNPLNNFNKIKRVVISTYQSMSGAGKSAMEALYDQTKKKFVYINDEYDEEDENYYEGEEQEISNPQGTNFAFNIIPQIGQIDVDGYSSEESKIILELNRILGEDIGITVTSVRVPVFIGHCFAVNIEFENDFVLDDMIDALINAPGLVVSKGIVTPVDISGSDQVFVSRVRQDNSVANAVNLWVSSDNLRKGAALNAVQIAEKLIDIL